VAAASSASRAKKKANGMVAQRKQQWRISGNDGGGSVSAWRWHGAQQQHQWRRASGRASISGMAKSGIIAVNGSGLPLVTQW
jgi:hypothetical protein